MSGNLFYFYHSNADQILKSLVYFSLYDSKHFCSFYSKFAGLSKKKVQKVMIRDNYMTALMAKEFGIVDDIIL